jgi:hypothetical protein
MSLFVRQPGPILWTLDTGRATITNRLYGTGSQGWYCPITGQAIPNDHTNIYQVNITGIAHPFHQTKDQMYWLVIRAQMGTTTGEVGWKTTAKSYFVRACYQTGGSWVSIAADMAFVITGGPTIEVDQLSMVLPAELITPMGKEMFTLTGPLTQCVLFEGSDEGDALDDNSNGLDEVDVEVTNINWVGNSSRYGTINVSKHPSIPSTGQIEEQINNTPGTLDVQPFTPVGNINFVFDLAFQIELGTQTLYSNNPLRISTVAAYKPPEAVNWSCNHYYKPLLDSDGSTARSYFVIGEYTSGETIEVDPFKFNRVELELHGPGGHVETVELEGFSSWYVFFSGLTEGDAYDNDNNGRDDVDTEMAAFDMMGSSTSFGVIKMRLNPNFSSYGEIEENVNNYPSMLDLPPFTATGSAESFFNIYFELELGGWVLHNAQPLRWSDVIDHKPPSNTLYKSYGTVALVDTNGNPTGYYIGPSIYRPGYCGPNPIGDFNLDCIVDLSDLAIFTQHWLECTRLECP